MRSGTGWIIIVLVSVFFIGSCWIDNHAPTDNYYDDDVDTIVTSRHSTSEDVSNGTPIEEPTITIEDDNSDGLIDDDSDDGYIHPDDRTTIDKYTIEVQYTSGDIDTIVYKSNWKYKDRSSSLFLKNSDGIMCLIGTKAENIRDIKLACYVRNFTVISKEIVNKK